MRRPPRRQRWIPLGLIAIVLACSAEDTRPPTPETLGFLEDYSQLEPGRAGQAKLIYIAPDADFSDYTHVVVDPVVAFGEPPSEEARHLAGQFERALQTQLALDFDLASEPGPGALRLRSAIVLKPASQLALEVEILDGATGARVVAAVDERQLPDSGPNAAETEFETWADIIRARLSAFRSYDAAQKAP